MRRWMLLSVLTTSVVAGPGCQTGLVTGYQPRRLGDSPAARKAYYAGRFTPEARAAEAERAEELRQRRPNANRSGGPAPY